MLRRDLHHEIGSWRLTMAVIRKTTQRNGKPGAWRVVFDQALVHLSSVFNDLFVLASRPDELYVPPEVDVFPLRPVMVAVHE